MSNAYVTISTRLEWRQWLTGSIDDTTTTARMIELGASEFIRFQGTRMVEVIVRSETGERRMFWRGTEEVLAELPGQ